MIRASEEQVRLYEDRHPWPIKCPACRNEFVEQIGRLTLHKLARCPQADCQSIVEIDPDFRTAVREAKAGAYNPFRHVWGLASRAAPSIVPGRQGAAETGRRGARNS
jgi:hypothetical protein